MVATSTERLPATSAIMAACGLNAPAKGGLLGSIFGRKATAPKDFDWKEGILVAPFRDGQLAVSLIPAPIPWSELEGPCATAWWWPEATQKMQAHRCHFLIGLLGGSMDPIERRVILTRLASAIVQNSDAVGVYWGEGTLVHEPREFVQQAEAVNAETIPGTLWIDVRIEKNRDGSLRCFTTGLAPLGFLEIEVEQSRLPPEELMGFIGDTACYIVNGRLHIKDGETMGRTATERYKVKHMASMFDRAPVMRLVMT